MEGRKVWSDQQWSGREEINHLLNEHKAALAFLRKDGRMEGRKDGGQ
jgi:hypothetical protein